MLARDDRGDIHEQDREEDCRDYRQEAPALFLPQRVFGDVDADEIHAQLTDILQTLRNQFWLPKSNNKEDHQYCRHEQANQHDTVQREPAIGEIFTNKLVERVPREKFWTQLGCVECTLHGQSCNAQRSLPFSGRT